MWKEQNNGTKLHACHDCVNFIEEEQAKMNCMKLYALHGSVRHCVIYPRS